MSDSEEESSPSGDEWPPVTGAWLEEMLAAQHAGARARVRDFTVRPGCDASESVLSDILAVSVTYALAAAGEGEEEEEEGRADAERHLDLIVKLLPQDPFSRFFVTEAQFDLREIKFYTQVVPELEAFERRQMAAGTDPLPLPIPRCFHALYAAGDGGGGGGDGGGGAESPPPPCESVLVLENLKARGFRGADFSRGLSARQAASALRAVARVHALSLALKVREGRALAERYPFLFQTARATDSYQQLVERGLPQLARFLERRPGSEGVLAALSALRPSTKEIIAALLAPREPLALITHTDFWCNNLLFRDADDREEEEEARQDDDRDDDPEEEASECECAVLDWQMVTYSRPTNDVALLLISSLPTALRRRRAARLLDVYWAALRRSAAALGVRLEAQLGYDRAQLQADYRRSQLLALLLCVGSVDVALGDPRTEQRLLDVLQDLHRDGVLDPTLALPDPSPASDAAAPATDA